MSLVLGTAKALGSLVRHRHTKIKSQRGHLIAVWHWAGVFSLDLK